MRKFLAIGLAVCFAAVASPAAGRLSFGLKVGANFANMTTADTDVPWTSKFGPTGGAYLTYHFSDLFAVQPEVLYSGKGAKYSVSDATARLDATVEAPYLEIPLLAKVYIPVGDASGFRPNLFAGPSLGIKLGGKIRYELAYDGQSDSSEDTLDSLKSTDFGLVFGGGLDFAFSGGKVTLDARYGLSLSSISSEGDNTRNKVISLYLGFSFN